MIRINLIFHSSLAIVIIGKRANSIQHVLREISIVWVELGNISLKRTRPSRACTGVLHRYRPPWSEQGLRKAELTGAVDELTGALETLLIIIIIIKGHSLRRAFLQP